MISKGCLYHLVCVKDSNSEGPYFYSILVVSEFSKVFWDYLLGVFLDREIEFGITLVPNTRSIFILP